MGTPGNPSSAAASFAPGPVHRAFALLQIVVAADRSIGVRELARRADLSHSTTGRMLAILTELGMVERLPDGSARPGAGLTRLTRRVEHTPAVLREQMRPLVVELQRTYDENAAVGIDDGQAFLYLVSARVPSAVQVADPVDERFEPHLVAPGIVTMAWWPQSRLEQYLAQGPRSATDHSVTAPAAIRRRLARVRRDRFAWTDQELDREVNGLAAPIRAVGGAVIAVATLYGPSYRFSQDLLPELGAAFAELVHDRSRVLLGIEPD